MIVSALQMLNRTEGESSDHLRSSAARSAAIVLSSIYRSTNSPGPNSRLRGIVSIGIVSLFSIMIDRFIETELGLEHCDDVRATWQKERTALVGDSSGKEAKHILNEADRFCNSLMDARAKSEGAANLYRELKALCLALVVQFPRKDHEDSKYGDTLFTLNQLVARLTVAGT